MARTSFLGDMLTNIFERRRTGSTSNDPRSITAMCEALLAGEGEVSGIQLSKEILGRYETLDRDARRAFFSFLNNDLELDPNAVHDLSNAYAKSGKIEDYRALTQASEPRRQELFRRLNQSVGATAMLVSMRVDLLGFLKDDPDLKRTDLDFVHLLRSWFNRGFLVLNQINWETPATVLDKIVAYEAVHAINDWDDLRRRLYPPDRRCFAYFHPSMPGEPLIFVEVALMRAVPGSIQHVLSETREPIAPEDTTVAVFYSISNCQKGLQGISFGNLLIKQVVDELRAELPGLKTFVTLSPIPGLNTWLDTQPHDPMAARVRAGRGTDAEVETIVAHYLLSERDAKGRPLDPVARFHLGNGAEIYDVHAGADTTENGRLLSSGAMVNYHYDLKKIEKNHERFVSGHDVPASRSVLTKAQPYEDQTETAEKA